MASSEVSGGDATSIDAYGYGGQSNAVGLEGGGGGVRTDVESGTEENGRLDGAAGFMLLESDFFCGGGCCVGVMVVSRGCFMEIPFL